MSESMVSVNLFGTEKFSVNSDMCFKKIFLFFFFISIQLSIQSTYLFVKPFIHRSNHLSINHVRICQTIQISNIHLHIQSPNPSNYNLIFYLNQNNKQGNMSWITNNWKKNLLSNSSNFLSEVVRTYIFPNILCKCTFTAPTLSKISFDFNILNCILRPNYQYDVDINILRSSFESKDLPENDLQKKLIPPYSEN